MGSEKDDLDRLRLTKYELVVPYHPHECSACKAHAEPFEAAVFEVKRRTMGESGGQFRPLCLACGAKAAVEHDAKIRAARAKWVESEVCDGK